MPWCGSPWIWACVAGRSPDSRWRISTGAPAPSGYAGPRAGAKTSCRCRSTTGRAIADYLRLERPQTTSRAVFVRRIAPCGRPIGPDCVGKTIRQAYARAGLPYSGAHLLRHTMASRLLASGSSLKEVADVLRHRSLNTTLIYAKLDTRSLSTVALPWPGDSK